MQLYSSEVKLAGTLQTDVTVPTSINFSRMQRLKHHPAGNTMDPNSFFFMIVPFALVVVPLEKAVLVRQHCIAHVHVLFWRPNCHLERLPQGVNTHVILALTSQQDANVRMQRPKLQSAGHTRIQVRFYMIVHSLFKGANVREDIKRQDEETHRDVLVDHGGIRCG